MPIDIFTQNGEWQGRYLPVTFSPQMVNVKVTFSPQMVNIKVTFSPQTVIIFLTPFNNLIRIKLFDPDSEAENDATNKEMDVKHRKVQTNKNLNIWRSISLKKAFE